MQKNDDAAVPEDAGLRQQHPDGPQPGAPAGRPVPTRTEEVLRRLAAIEEQGRILEQEMARSGDLTQMRTQLGEVRDAVLAFEGYLTVTLSSRLDEIVNARLTSTAALMRQAGRARFFAWFWFLMLVLAIGLLVAEARIGSVSAAVADWVPQDRAPAGRTPDL